jgi:hypothetical protein
MTRRSLLLSASLIALFASGTARAGEDRLDRTLPLPKDGGAILVNAKLGDLAVEQVIVRNAPNPQDYEKAAANPKEGCHPHFTVELSNNGSSKVKAKVVVSLESPEGKTLLKCDTKEKVEAGVKNLASNLCWLQSIAVNDWPKAKLHLVVTR